MLRRAVNVVIVLLGKVGGQGVPNLRRYRAILFLDNFSDRLMGRSGRACRWLRWLRLLPLQPLNEHGRGLDHRIVERGIATAVDGLKDGPSRFSGKLMVIVQNLRKSQLTIAAQGCQVGSVRA